MGSEVLGLGLYYVDNAFDGWFIKSLLKVHTCFGYYKGLQVYLRTHSVRISKAFAVFHCWLYHLHEGASSGYHTKLIVFLIRLNFKVQKYD